MYLRLSPYREILQGVLTDLAVNEGIIKITGKAGAGKTALCSQLYRDLESKGQNAVFFLTPPAGATALQNSILDSLKLDTTGNFTKTLTAWLIENVKEHMPLVLIFDDAQHLDQQAFSAIRMLCNIQDASHALIRVIICGTEALDQKLATPALRAVTQFLSQSVTVPFLSLEQMHDFCQGYWLQMAVDIKPMSLKVQQKLFQETRGRPGILQVRLNQGTTGAETLERKEGETQTSAGTRPGRYPGQRPGWVPALLIMAGLIVLVGGGYLFLFQDPPGSATEATVAIASAPATPSLAQPVSEPASTPVVVEALPVPAAETQELATEVVEAVVTETVVAETVVAETVVAESENPVAAVTVTEAIDVPELPQVEAFIATWAGSWQSRDVDAYLAHYHPEFTPAGNLTLNEWQDQRRRVIGNAGEILITVVPPELTAALPDGKRSVRFWLYYSTTNYADRTLKELVLVPMDGNWRILTEINMRTERD